MLQKGAAGRSAPKPHPARTCRRAAFASIGLMTNARRVPRFASPLLLTAAVFVGCAAPARKADAPATTHYYGSVKISSPDGKTPFGESVSLVRREIRPADGKILESVLQPPRKPGDKPREFLATLTRVGNTNEFMAGDAEHSFSGKQVFEGKDWDLPRWSYQIRLASGGRIAGSGALDAQGIKTRKTIYGADEKPSMLMEEDLRPISPSDYARRRAEMLK